MTVGELLQILQDYDETDLVAIKHPTTGRGYYPADDDIYGTLVTKGPNTYHIIALELRPWPEDAKTHHVAEPEYEDRTDQTFLPIPEEPSDAM